ncbi:DUF1553 domain-containing protein [Neorhodopirellula pilleata]|uniref:Planctomycete cytochrome C n=1 Tax=Neorhodopirellula pilleata TaxID=2714738 RepID=A0A5C6AVR4_9BACT|nr:DUF1553 domain-containing protein [Neorhodopirellula pilleata]TWU03142.1 Planctomycete cytochrome C [Neorhodopirellula pilleata]
MRHLILQSIQRTLLVMAGFLSVGSVHSADIPSQHVTFFENKVRPLLAEHCFECHSEDEASGELRLDSFGDMLLGGESGAAIVPGKPGESVLIEAINYESFEMPPDEKLSDADIETLTRWVAIGAPWPGADPNAPVRKREHFDEQDRAWWAIQPITAQAPPRAEAKWADWARNEIDLFTLAKMQSEGLTPAPEASRRDLVRRVYLQTVGLPPTPEQVDEFLNDPPEDAYDRLVDRLLESKGYGEHVARQWLDLARYAESDGYRADEYRPHAWRYRDYVIKSFNDDKPYDRFVQEQLAADEMFPDDLDAQVGLTFLRHWVYEWNIRDAPTQWNTIIEDLTDTTADVFLGLGLQCAKCHNHKFDPLLQKDYFRLRAFFDPVMPVDLPWATNDQIERYQQALAKWEANTQTIRDQIAEIENPYREKYRNIAIDRFPEDVQAIARKATEDRTPYEAQIAYLVQRQVQEEYDRLNSYIKADDKEKLVVLRKQLSEYDANKPAALPVIMAVRDQSKTPPPTVIPKRKNDLILPGIPTILTPEPMPIESVSETSTGRRTALAKWITDPANPLTARVIANRVWQLHFGRGLAANTSDFGVLGGPPTHPELLDWLATQLVTDGWSLKALHRRVLLSATFRQSTEHPQFTAYSTIDPANDYYWRRNTTRLSAEQIRDSLLAVSGKLKDRNGGGGVHGDSPYRSVYMQVRRNSPDELLASFDLPLFFNSNSSRNTTTTPIQSLLMFNSDRMLGHARKFAQRISSQSDQLEDQIASAWNLAFARPPTKGETQASLAFIKTQTDRLRAIESKKQEQTTAIETSKLPYRDGQAVKFAVKDPTLQLIVHDDERLNVSDFTVEAFFQLQSVDNGGEVRTLVAKWNRSKDKTGWRFGVTGKGSRRKPQTLVLQAFGKLQNGKVGEAAIFSDQHIEMDTPYYASASVKLATGDQPGTVTFFLKDLSNDDEPLGTAVIEHTLAGDIGNASPLTIGRVAGNQPAVFDGLIDDVRLVNRAIGEEEILYTTEKVIPGLIGFWQFEVDPGVMENTVTDELPIVARGDSIIVLSPQESALVDFCHALLNSNEFLYIN